MSQVQQHYPPPQYPAQAPYTQQQQQPYQPYQQQQQPYQQQQQQPYQPQPAAPPQGQSVTYTTLYKASGTPVHIVNAPPSDGTYQNYRTAAAKRLGIMQIACGLVIFVAQVVVTAIHARGFEGFAGFWAPVFFFLAGGFGVQSSKTKSQCTVVSTMVLSIVASVISIGPITQGSVGVSMQRSCYYSWEYNYYHRSCEMNSNLRAAVAFHAIILIFGFIEAVVAIMAAAYCCHGCCCYSRQGVVISQNPQVGPMPIATGGMQMGVVQYQMNPGQYYQAQYYPAPAMPVPTVSASTYQAEGGATGPLPAYSSATSPPEYTEKN